MTIPIIQEPEEETRDNQDQVIEKKVTVTVTETKTDEQGNEIQKDQSVTVLNQNEQSKDNKDDTNNQVIISETIEKLPQIESLDVTETIDEEGNKKKHTVITKTNVTIVEKVIEVSDDENELEQNQKENSEILATVETLKVEEQVGVKKIEEVPANLNDSSMMVLVSSESEQQEKEPIKLVKKEIKEPVKPKEILVIPAVKDEKKEPVLGKNMRKNKIKKYKTIVQQDEIEGEEVNQ